jgi:hypothetical protein
METKNKMTSFLDAVGRTILGEHNEEKSTETILAVDNPVVLHVEKQDQAGRMSVQLLPIFFREFLADKTGDVSFFYKKNNITECTIDAYDFRLKAQYDQMFNKQNLFVPPTVSEPAPTQGQANPAIINLFDD